jgi:thiol-disulfide isomerase/thioredoxin/tetratricopeptide (TPR) repeat protein
MKKSILFFVVCIILSQVVYAQNKSSLTLSNEYPQVGKTYYLFYDPKGTPLDKQKKIGVKMYYFTDPEKNVSSIEIPVKKKSGTWKAKFELPKTAKAFYFSVSADKKTDTNNGNGYTFFVYNNGKPVVGANAFIATLYVFDNPGAGTIKNIDLATSYLNREFEQYPDSRKPFTQTYYNVLLNSGDENKKVLLTQTIYESFKSDKEKDWMTARHYFYQLKRNKTFDSITVATEIKFPFGEIARGDQAQNIYNAKTAGEKEEAYKVWILKFPPAKVTGSKIGYDYASNSVANAFAKEKNVKKALFYADKVITPVWRGEGWAGPASQLEKNGFLNEALVLYKKAAANSAYFMEPAHKDEAGAAFAAIGYPGYNNSIAEILYLQKKYAAALLYVQKAYKSSNEPKAYINNNYAKILTALGRNGEAFDKMDELVKSGQATPEILEGLKKLYVKKYKSDKNYETYLANANKEMVAKIIKELPGQMINIPSHNFTLTDVDGKTVSLADYKGKIVVLDFWATWCGPCKASFPAMQMAANKFKDDEDVKFLFIHTWERENTATQMAKKYVTDNGYNFEVLMDLKDKETGINKVVESFNVTGIPAKFILDKNGNIRFKLTGFSGGNDAAVAELSEMIALAGKS